MTEDSKNEWLGFIIFTIIILIIALIIIAVPSNPVDVPVEVSMDSCEEACMFYVAERFGMKHDSFLSGASVSSGLADNTGFDDVRAYCKEKYINEQNRCCTCEYGRGCLDDIFNKKFTSKIGICKRV